jgi:hypothetical protein
MKTQSVSKQEAIDVIEDALTVNSPYMHGVAVGLCGAFHMAGILTKEEMEEYVGATPESDFVENYLH